MPARFESKARVRRARAALSSAAVGSKSIEPSGIIAQQTATTSVRIGTLASRSAKQEAFTVAWNETVRRLMPRFQLKSRRLTAKEEPLGSTVWLAN